MGDAEELAHLRARITGLEAALARRSRELRVLQRLVCDRDLLIIARLAAGLPPLVAGPYDIQLWQETSELLAADLEETMRELWDSVVPSERSRDA